MQLPKISINISVVTNDDAGDAILSLERINYPKDLFEIIIIQGSHLTKQRNKGIEYSRGDIIYLLDNDSQVQPNAFRLLAKEFSDMQVAAVGGPSLTPMNEQNNFSRVVGYVLETYFGAFRMRYKWSKQTNNKETSDYHFIGSNLALRKKFVEKIGGFDEKFKANDETDLLRRLKDKGYRLKYTDKLIVFRHQRNNVFQLMKQFHHYGKGRMQHLLKNHKKEDFFLLAPICFELYLLSLIFFHPAWYLSILGLYILLATATSLKASIKYRRRDLLWKMALLSPVIHISYATGLLNELLDRIRFKELLKPDKKKHVVKIIRYKTM